MNWLYESTKCNSRSFLQVQEPGKYGTKTDKTTVVGTSSWKIGKIPMLCEFSGWMLRPLTKFQLKLPVANCIPGKSKYIDLFLSVL